MFKTCKDCGIPKPESDYTPSLWKNGVYRCRPCKTAYGKKRKAVVGSGAYRTAKLHQWRSGIKTRCDKSGVKFELTVDHLRLMLNEQDNKCAISKIELMPPQRGGWATWDSPSVDRIKPELGYVPGNVRLVLHCINSFRGSMSDEQMISVARAMVDNASAPVLLS